MRHSIRTLLLIVLTASLVACSSSSTVQPDSRVVIVPDAADSSSDSPVVDAPSVDPGAEAGLDAAVVDSAGDLGPDGPEGDAGPLASGLQTFAGANKPGDADGLRDKARFVNPVNVVVAKDGTVFVAEFDSGSLRRITPEGRVSTVIANNANFGRPFGMAFDKDGLLYIETDLDSSGGKTGAIWSVDLTASGTPDIVLNNAGRARGMVALPDGKLLLSFFVKHVIKIFDPKTKQMTLVAGKEDTSGFDDKIGAEARFNNPYDIVLLGADEALVADKGNNRLRKVAISTGKVDNWAGDGTAASTDGARMAGAQFNAPQGLAIDSAGVVYVSDFASHKIRKIAADGSVTTIAGSIVGWRDDVDPLKGRLMGVEGIDLSPDGTLLYIADGNQGLEETEPACKAIPGCPAFHRVRRLTLP